MPASSALVTYIVTTLCVVMAAFHFHAVLFGAPQVFTFRGMHLLFALVLVFLVFPMPRGGAAGRVLDVGFAALAVVAIGYLIMEQDYLFTRFQGIDPLRPIDRVLGVALVLLVLEGARRTTGTALPLTALGFMIWGVYGAGLTPDYLLDVLYLSTEGIFGIPLGVSATYMVLFIVFGAFVQVSGTGTLFMDASLAIAGRTAGGPAKVAVMTSALFGTISGSSTANVMTTGTFTIPMMKRLGYRPAFAGAVEAVASTGGQIMPPIMGAAAFVMAEFMGTSYLRVVQIAAIPAVLYFVCVFAAVHFEAKRHGLAGLPAHELPSLRRALLDRGHQILPIFLIVFLLFSGFSAPYAAMWGCISVFPIALLRRTSRQDAKPSAILDGVVTGIKNTLQVAMACACAGIVIAVIGFSGLGLEFTSLLRALARDSLLLALIVTAVAGIILGMGLPTTPAYIVQTALLVPALMRLGVVQEAAHLFVFYFAILSVITPPVAISLYAANSLSGAKLWPAGAAALKLASTGYIVPFMFAFGPALLLIGTPVETVTASLTALVGVIMLAAGLHGWLLRAAPLWERALLVAGALVLIHPDPLTDLGGAVLLAVPLLRQMLARRAETLAITQGRP
jgi:TRAP transporter 4TM/12TM fusion protein